MSDRSETVRVWLVERTYSDDEQNLIILVYATPDGERYPERTGDHEFDGRPTDDGHGDRRPVEPRRRR